MNRLSWQRIVFPTVLILIGFFIALFFIPPQNSDSSGFPIINRITKTISSDDKYIQIYKESNEAVVFITTITFTVDPFDPFLEVYPKEGSGSGIIVDSKEGIIVTNLHVIKDAHRIEIILSDGTSNKARLVGYDEGYDLAVLQLHNIPDNLKSVPFGDSSDLQIGQAVLAIGNPFGLERTLTTGVVSSLNRAVKNPFGSILRGMIQTDAAINPGNSGGPLLNLDGKLVGVNTAILSNSGEFAGIGFAVPINTVKRILPELIATGKVLRPDLGWVLADTTHGAMVRRVTRGGPAYQAGVQPLEIPIENPLLKGYIRNFDQADLVIEVNNAPVKSREEVEVQVAEANPREKLKFLLSKGGIDGERRVVYIQAELK